MILITAKEVRNHYHTVAIHCEEIDLLELITGHENV